MDKLKNIIENTLCVNLEINDETEAIDFESVQTCSDYISKEIQDIAIGFAEFTKGKMFTLMNPESKQDQFNQFINERYKLQP